MLFSYKLLQNSYFKGEISIDTQRIPPKTIQIYKRLLQRVPLNHPVRQEIENKINITEAGYFGECYVDNFLKQIFFPKHFAILKDVHIPLDQNSFIQLDTLIITRKYICVLEIKNIKGKIHFQRNPNQLVRELNGVTTTYKCPEQQLNRHIKKLQTFLKQSKINIPVKGLIVFAYSSTHIVQPPQFAKITMGCDIPEHIEAYNELPDVLSQNTLNRLLTIIANQSTEFVPKPLAQTYNLELSHFRTGLICPICLHKIANKKHCPICKTSCNIMQQQAIEDWFYLCRDTISNRECVYFLELKDKFAANYLLTKLHLDKTNEHRYRHYSLSKSFWLINESSPLI